MLFFGEEEEREANLYIGIFKPNDGSEDQHVNTIKHKICQCKSLKKLLLQVVYWQHIKDIDLKIGALVLRSKRSA